MFLFFLGIIVGLFLKLVCYFVLTKLLFPKTTFVRRKLRPMVRRISDPQKIFFTEALKFTKDVAWCNLIIQRWFEIAKDNFYFLEKMKTLIIKKFSFAIKKRLIKKIKINKLIFRECPYIKEIKCLTKNEFDQILNRMGMKEESSEEENAEEEGCNDFNHLLILAKTEFSGSVIVNITATFPGDLLYEMEITLASFQGDVVARIPSKNHLTRFDTCFVSNPNFEIYFKDEDKNIKIRTIKKIFMYALNKNVIYPTWNSFYMPMVVPTLKDITHPVYKIDFKNFSEISDEIELTIKTYSCMDYKIIKKYENYTKRRGQYYINGKNRIIRYDLPVKNDFSMTHFFDFTFFNDLFSTFVALKKVKKLDEKSSLVIIYFTDASYQFIRIKTENGVIFQGLNFSDFLYFEIKGKVLIILQFSTNKNLEFTEKRIERIVRKMLDKQSKTLGSSKLHSLISFSKEKANVFFKKQLIYPEKCNISIQQFNLKSSFDKFREIERNDYFINELTIQTPKILLDSYIRLQLFDGKFVAQTDKEENIYSTILETKNKDFIVNSLEEKNLIIDFDTEEKNVFIFEIEESKLKLYSKEIIKPLNFYNFSTLVKFYNKYYSLESEEKFDEFSWANELEIPFDGKKGSISLEYYNKAETQIQLSIYNVETNDFLLKKMIIPNSSNFKFIFPSIDQKYSFSFKTTAKYNQWSRIRIRQLNETVYFLNCNLFLAPKKEIKIPVLPSKDDILHWKIPANLQISTSLKKDVEFVNLSTNGLFSADNKEYVFCYKNTSTDNAIFNIWLGYTKIDN